MLGITFDHSLGPTTYYSLRITRTHKRYDAYGPRVLRDTTIQRYFGKTPVDGVPWGYKFSDFPWGAGYELPVDGMTQGLGGYTTDSSEVTSLNFKGDLTSQLHKYHKVQIGVLLNYDDLYSRYGRTTWKHYPIRVGAYIQDKVEFAGIIANIGVRLDYSDPNCEWYTLDKYSYYLSALSHSALNPEPHKDAPSEPAEGHLKISPRFGISHPISEFSKLYFNYGWFYSMAPSIDLYRVTYKSYYKGVGILADPSADLPRTVAYELGYAHNIANMFLLEISGYYKDVTDQTGSVSYTNYDGTIDYSTTENNNYADIRGFEVTLEKRVGPWITGWINYDYMVITSGYVGRKHYYEDSRVQRIYGLQNPYQERPTARPVARANIRFMSPKDFGPTIAGIKPFGDIQLNFLYSWKSGEWMTWDPLATYELKDNLQWINYSIWDVRLGKGVEIGGTSISFFMDIHNLFNTKHLHTQGFADGEDRNLYLTSLHLPMYEGEEYQAAGLVAGNDKPGDIKSEDKPYINMPNREFLTYLDQRYIFFGFRFNF